MLLGRFVLLDFLLEELLGNGMSPVDVSKG